MLFLILLVCLSNGLCQSIDKSIFQEANAGISNVYASGLSGIYDFEDNTATNTAKSVQGIANAGLRLIFGGGSVVQDSQISRNSSNLANQAISNQNKAISGSQVVFSTIQDSDVTLDTFGVVNQASVVGIQGDAPTSVSGAQTLASSVQGSNVTLRETSTRNTATNSLRKAIVGVDSAFGKVRDSYIQTQNEAVDNFAQAVRQNRFGVLGICRDGSEYSSHKLLANILEGIPARAGLHGKKYSRVTGKQYRRLLGTYLSQWMNLKKE